MTVAPFATASMRLAVFDVDETILSIKGLFSFAEYFFCTRSGATGMVHGLPYEEWIALLQTTGRTSSRERVNRLFYTAFTGYDLDLMQQSARDWFTGLILREEAIFVRATLTAVHFCRQRGIPVALLSGSARIFLAPLARLIDATHVVAIEMETDSAGMLTGAILAPQTIGDGKWRALQALLDEIAITPAQCVGCGDHCSDLPFLVRLGRACIVAGNDSMEKFAHTSGWEILPSTAVAFFPPAPHADFALSELTQPV